MACPHCDDTGWKPVEADGVRRVVRCECWREKLMARLVDEARIPPRYKNCDLEKFHTYNDSLARAVAVARRFIEAFPVVDKGLVLLGKPGVGKTHLATACLKDVIRRTGARGLFYDSCGLLRLIRDTYNPEVHTTEIQIIQPVMAAQLLVLDDLGAEKPSEWVAETLNLIVNTRYNDRRPTIITTNYPDLQPSEDATSARDPKKDESLIERIGVRMYSRLHEMCEFLKLDGVDCRELGPNPSAEELASLYQRGSRAHREMPARSKGMAKAQLRSDKDKIDLGWTGGKAGSRD